VPKKGRPNLNTKLSGLEEKVICRYINRLNYINLTVRLEFITDTVNTLL
jgi:hypothetical protein